MKLHMSVLAEMANDLGNYVQSQVDLAHTIENDKHVAKS